MKRALIFIPYSLLIFLIIILADLGKLPLHLLMKIPHYDGRVFPDLFSLPNLQSHGSAHGLSGDTFMET